MILFLLFLNGLVLSIQWVEESRRQLVTARVESAMPSQQATLELLSDYAERSGVEVQSAEASGAQERCLLVGPLDNETSASRLLEALIVGGLRARLYTNALELAPEYWVYLPPFSDRASAIQVLKDLQSKRIDSFLITQGELKNGISLGFFRNSDTAEVLQMRRKRQGLDAKIRVVPKSRTEYWLLLDDGATLDLRARVELIALGLDHQVSTREISCRRVAT